jgi:hypothetical protein
VDALTSRLSTRFLVVTVVPNILFIGYIGFLLAAGAPAHSPSLARATKVLDGLTIRQIVVLLLGTLIISFATHPLQTPLVQFVEGYWRGLPFGRVATDLFTERFRDELCSAEKEMKRPRDAKSFTEARRRKYWLPPKEYLLPTALGNTLWQGENRAGERYGLELDVAMPRLIPLLSDSSIAELRDRRNQLDVAVRLSVVAGLATAIGVGLLLWHASWLFLPLVTSLLCWASYRAAVAAARGFSVSLAAAIDLHHLQLFDALQLERPANLKDEYDLNTTLVIMFRDGLIREDRSELNYIPKADKTSGD